MPAWPHVVALHANGNVRGWGTDNFGEASGAPGGVKFKAIAAGLTYSLGIDLGGELHHWGNPWSGTGPGVGTGVSLAMVPKGKFFAISAGSRHATAIRHAG